MIRRIITSLQQSLAMRITTWVMVSLLLLIIFIISGAHWITTNFYQDHLISEVEERLSAHASLLKSEQNEEVLNYLNMLETGKDSYLIITDENLDLIFESENVESELVGEYRVFIEENRDEVATHHRISFTEQVDTSMAFHIPHVWGTTEIESETGETIGYVFIDQDTGDLNSARMNLLLLLLVMGALTFIIGYAFILYLTKRVSNPLNEMSKRTEDIAKGDFDIDIDTKGKDEVGQLGLNIQQMTRQLKEYRDTRRQFISHISHDLRTPITYIKGYSALMKDSEKVDHEGWKRNLQVIYDEARRMENLVSDLFLLTKLEEGKIHLHYDTVDLTEWLHPLFQSRAIMFDQKEITASLTIDPSIKNDTILLDSFRMEQALINLLENAIRYTGVQGQINLSCYKKEKMLVFEISDTGEGMEADKIDFIWERFYKTDPSRSRDESGTGLGLAIVKEIILAHKGHVKVESEKGVGTTFYLYIPLMK
ncbi:sensor histidine kinase [Salipaludibacillus daqingensis]|uniref:sensor histidine kinase n=1 Tax=Salipaludibacillus daqingensis TaxID=3041001 RepID=UPI0024747715|nr:HAMP domain-containing sensor histidine kinase [Salipaludibacillus daqingensis]